MGSIPTGPTVDLRFDDDSECTRDRVHRMSRPPRTQFGEDRRELGNLRREGTECLPAYPPHSRGYWPLRAGRLSATATTAGLPGLPQPDCWVRWRLRLHVQFIAVIGSARLGVATSSPSLPPRDRARQEGSLRQFAESPIRASWSVGSRGENGVGFARTRAVESGRARLPRRATRRNFSREPWSGVVAVHVRR